MSLCMFQHSLNFRSLKLSRVILAFIVASHLNMTPLVLLSLLFALSLSKLSSTLQNSSIKISDDEANYRRLNCHYPSVTVHKFALKTEKCPDKWTDFCEIPEFINVVCVYYMEKVLWKS